MIVKTGLILLILLLSLPSRWSYGLRKFTLHSLSMTSHHEREPPLISRKDPVLTVTDPHTKSKVHLVGVSHGSPISAQLVTDMIQSVNPEVIVLELCEERYLALSLESGIAPKGNDTLESLYVTKKQALAERLERAVPVSKTRALLSSTSAHWHFLKKQGPLVGSFVGVGLLFSNFQRMFKDLPDEFTTAMLKAEEMDIPIRLGDASQSQTLNNIKKLISVETFNPILVWKGAKSFLFSAIGLFSKYQEPYSHDSSVEQEANWVNIPAVYFGRKDMIGTLWPLYVAILGTMILSFLSSLGSMPNVDNIDADVLASPSVEQFFQWITQPNVESSINLIGDIFATLLVIRLGRLIGTDRDRILASNIQKVCAEFPGKEVVAVVGMLHCNGVAKWIISGRDPLSLSELDD
eukprot:gene4340-4760_t